MKTNIGLVDQVKPMNQPQEPQSPEQYPASHEVQQGRDRGIARDERLKRAIRQHPQRDEPKVDSVEPGEGPPRP